MEKNSRRGRKPIPSERKLQVLRTSKAVKIVINDQDTLTVPKGKNLLIVREL